MLHPEDETLHSHGRRMTLQRELILRVLREDAEHLSALQILQRVQEQNPCITLSTVYRSLEVLQEVGLAREVHLPGEKTKYEAVEGKGHHHLICRECGTITNLESVQLSDLVDLLQEQYHFHGAKLDLIATGYCEACWRKMEP